VEERLRELVVEIAAGVATVTLNRPSVLNALSFGMLEELAERLDAWERDDAVASIVLRGAGDRAFCAGGDIRSLHGALKSGKPPVRYFEVEYALDQRIHEYPKPITALIDGIVMGGGMGISQGARRRLVGDRTRMAMPETAIGLFPDVGGSYFLSRCRGQVGLYLGLVGPTIGAADAIYCGLADAYVEGAQARGPSEIERLRSAIDEHFSRASVAEIVASLGREERPEWRDWARTTRDALLRRSPTMLCVTFEQLRRGAALSLGDCFAMELDLIQSCMEHPDMLEGIRALIVDKDNQPRWNPASLDEVNPADIERFFTKRKK
jgi:enoyl-CoA hydratase/carnithine racemase